mgnify:CR=1 FL=1|tara:strand:- start:989 stop:1306 length:318 start_codon:yes stop_codon:yes gene_type:complete
MSSSESLIKAAVNRLTARIGQKVLDSAAEMAVLAEDAPDRLRKEWELLKEEIVTEAERLEKENNEDQIKKQNGPGNYGKEDKPQNKIDSLRRKVTDLSNKVEGLN